MQKSIICIKGSSQTGKTPSIRDVYSLIAPKEEQMQNTQFLQDGYDINCHTKYKGVQVGFYSCGDPGSVNMKKSLNIYRTDARL